jgi:hypothetical protein
MEGCAMSVHSHKLPILAQAKLKDMEQRALELDLIARATGQRIKDFQAEIENNPDAPDIADAEYELSRLRAMLSQQQARHRQFDQLVSHLGSWLRALSPNADLVDARPAKLATKKGEKISDAVFRIRQEIETHQAELALIKQAKPPVAELKQKARDYVRDLAKRGAPAIKADHAAFEVTFQTTGWSSAVQLHLALAWLDPELLIKRLEQEIDQMPKPALALTANEKADRWASLQSELSALGRKEEYLIESAADDGQEIARRVDADPAAVLNVVEKTKVQNVA